VLDGATLAEAAYNAEQARATEGVGDRMADVITLVGQHPEGIGPTAVGFALGLEASTAGKYLVRAYDKGRIRRTGRGLYTPVQSVESVQTWGDDETPLDTLDGLDTPIEGPRS
jgi:hypothetical protein